MAPQDVNSGADADPSETTTLLNKSGSVSPKYAATVQREGSQSTLAASNSDAVDAQAEGSDKKEVKVNILAVMIPMALGVFLVAMDGTIVVSSYASIGSEFNQLQSTSWLATAFMLTNTSFQPLYGKLSDIFGRKACLLFAYAVFTAGSLLCGVAPTMGTLICARALAGVGGGGMTTVSSVIASDIVPLRSRGVFQGIMNIVFASGSAAGAPLGGILTGSIGWRWAFLIQVPMMLAAILIIVLALRLPPAAGVLAQDSGENGQQKRDTFTAKLARVDFAGALSLVLAVFFLLAGLDHGANAAWSAPRTIAALALSLALAVLFAGVEGRWAREPLAPARIVLSRSLLAAYLVNFFAFAASMCSIFHVSLYFQAVRRRSAAQAGVLLLPAIVGGVLGSLGGGWVMKRSGRYYWLTVGAYGVMVLGAVGNALWTGVVGHSLVAVCVGMFFVAIGNGCGVTSTLIALISNAGAKDQAVATALSYLFRSLGSVVGISVGSALVQEVLRTSLRRKLHGRDIDVDEIIIAVRESLSTIDALPPDVRAAVRSSYEGAVQAALWLVVALGACALGVSAFVRERSLEQAAYEGERSENEGERSDSERRGGESGGGR